MFPIPLILNLENLDPQSIYAGCNLFCIGGPRSVNNLDLDFGSMIAYYKLNDGGGNVATDSSYNRNDAVSVLGDQGWSTDIPPKFQSLTSVGSYSGLTNYLRANHLNQHDVPSGSPLSVFARIKFSTTTGDKTIVRKGSSYNTNYGLRISNSTLQFFYGVPQPTNTLSVLTGPSLSANTWYNVGFTGILGSGETGKLYVDGVVRSSNWGDYANIGPVQTSGSLNISEQGNPFYGLISDVRIFNKILSQNEIEENNQQGLTLYTEGGFSTYTSLYAAGHISSSGDLPLYTEGAGGSNYFNLTTAGSILTSGSTDLYTVGPLLSSGYLPLYTKGAATISLSLYCKGGNDVFASMNLMAKGPFQPSGSSFLNLCTTGFIPQSVGGQSVVGQVTLVTTGTIKAASGSMNLFAQVVDVGTPTSSMNLYAAGFAPSVSSSLNLISYSSYVMSGINLYTYGIGTTIYSYDMTPLDGGYPSSSYMNLVIPGPTVGSLTLFLKGVDGVPSGNLPLYVIGANIPTNTLSLSVPNSYGNFAGSQPLYTHGF